MRPEHFAIAAWAGLLLFASPRPAAAADTPTLFPASPGTNTLAVARDTVRAWRAHGHPGAPATILLSPGEYALTAPLLLDSRDSHLTWTARDSRAILITGGLHLAGLAPLASGVWQAQTPLHFEQLYVNAHRATRARWPAHGWLKMQSVRQDDAPRGKVRLTVQLPDTNSPAFPPDPASYRDAQIFAFFNWDTSRYPVSTVDPAARTLTVIGERMAPWNPWNSHTRFFLDNCAGGQPLPDGSWLLDAHGTLSYCPLDGESIGKSDFVAPALDRLVEINGADDVLFQNLRFQYSKYDLPPDGCPPAQAASAIAASIQINHARQVAFQHCQIAHTGNYALWFERGCHDCRVEHCLLEDLGAGGIRIGEMTIRDDPRDQTDGLVIDNNIIRQYGLVHPSAVAVWIGQSANNRVTHNDLSDAFYTAISVGWTWGYGRSQATNNFIGYNRIHGIGQGVLSDMGGIYTLGVSPGSASIGNVIFDVRAHDYGGWGIYPDEGSTGWRIASNLVWRCTCVDPPGGGAFHQHYGATNLIANNLFALSSGPPMQATRVENHLSFILEHNLIVSSNTAFFSGPWDKINFASRSNCFVALGATPSPLFPHADLPHWQALAHESGSILTTCDFTGPWPHLSFPPHSPAYSAGFQMFNTKLAGVYGDRAWRRLAAAPPIAPSSSISPE